MGYLCCGSIVICIARLENAIWQVQARFVVRALAKHFLAVLYTKFFRPTLYLKKNIIIFVRKLPEREFIFLQLAT
jgi:hypothetical protein